MYTKEDVEAVSRYIKENNLQKVYVVGVIGSGKSSFAEEISSILGYTNIELDLYSQSFSKEMERDPTTEEEILDFALTKNTPPFIINHTDLLRQGLLKGADIVIFLNIRKEELLKTREMRERDGVEGDWKNIGPEKYDEIIEENIKSFDDLKGEIVYKNEASGTIVKKL